MFILHGVVVVVWAVWFPASFGFYASMGSAARAGGFLGIPAEPLVLLLLVGWWLLIVNRQPRDEWLAWSALTLVPAVDVLYRWRSDINGLARVVEEIILIGCWLYAFGIFRCRLRKGQLPSSPNAGPATE